MKVAQLFIIKHYSYFKIFTVLFYDESVAT